MPSKKGTAAYIARLSRVKGERTITRLGKILKDPHSSAGQKLVAKATSEQIKKAIQETYTGRKPLTGKRLQAVRIASANIESLVAGSKIATGKYGAANLSTQFQLNLATKRYKGADAALEQASNPSVYSREEVKTFYRVTQRIWQNQDGTPTDTAQINKRIMKYFRTASLETAFERAMSQPSVRHALEIAEGKIDQNANLTEEQRRFYERAESADNEQDTQRSPDYLVYVVQFDPNKDWREQVK